ncbi:DUF862, eukaryotic domain-containing protein [Rozella allomycis CSF55]|uniref:DUF862, eukaryotic domain-containing protein n=1 Tax=Rozella allomycis (strain CSF55) TaxID=988480 RepID=A0A075ASW0_ROZAC|nr:DUF862, eukaryotic domain-containing protein [Rozella allomycis CSF55]|eukprot:EPZ31815.1 DUF862, eukaryotic domain-containing protein [Rozella allomycis CSF55]
MSDVYLYVYDLSRGMAKQLGPMFQVNIDAIYHTSVVVFRKEYYYGQGIHVNSRPGETIYGATIERIKIGETCIDEATFKEYLSELSQSKYRMDSYHLLDQNCNHFSDDVSFFLTGKRIPSHIVELPENVMKTPLGQLIRPFIEQMFGPSQINDTTPLLENNIATNKRKFVDYEEEALVEKLDECGYLLIKKALKESDVKIDFDLNWLKSRTNEISLPYVIDGVGLLILRDQISISEKDFLIFFDQVKEKDILNSFFHLLCNFTFKNDVNVCFISSLIEFARLWLHESFELCNSFFDTFYNILSGKIPFELITEVSVLILHQISLDSNLKKERWLEILKECIKKAIIDEKEFQDLKETLIALDGIQIIENCPESVWKREILTLIENK